MVFREKAMKKHVLSTLLCLSVFLSCAQPSGGPKLQDPMTGRVDVIYLHHSTGGVVWSGGVPDAVASYNSGHSTDYQITERAYPSGSPYPWNNYPYDYWNIWVNNAGPTQFMSEDTLEILTQNYEVIVFKHCFPVSAIDVDSGTADVASESKQLQNYYLQYNAIKTKMHEFPNTRFIVWTGAALKMADTNPDSAQRARTFFSWVRDTWDAPGDNIYVWDFWTLETGGENELYLLDANADSLLNDSHPNVAFAAAVAPYFANRLVDVIEGRGDTGDITGRN